MSKFPTKHCVIWASGRGYRGRSEYVWHDAIADAAVFRASAVKNICERSGWERVPVDVVLQGAVEKAYDRGYAAGLGHGYSNGVGAGG